MSDSKLHFDFIDEPMLQPTPSLTSSQQAVISSPELSTASNSNPPLQSKGKRTFDKFSESSVQQNRIPKRRKNHVLHSDAVSQNGHRALVSATLQFPKPIVSYRFLSAMALKNSRTGSLLISEIFSFISDHFPYFNTAVEDWRAAVRSALYSSELFAKAALQINRRIFMTSSKKYWTINPMKIAESDEEIEKYGRIYEKNIRRAMAVPDDLPALLKGVRSNTVAKTRRILFLSCAQRTS